MSFQTIDKYIITKVLQKNATFPVKNVGLALKLRGIEFIDDSKGLGLWIGPAF